MKKVNVLADERDVGFKNPSWSYNIFVRIGGILLGIFVLGTVVYFLIKEQNFPQPVSISTSGAVQKIVLPDSSRVTLNRNSEVIFPKTYTGNSREVYLKGEGFFNVTHDKEKPFIVHTPLADVRVLGTSFNVQIDKNHVEVGVAEGTVLIMTPTDSGYVKAGNMGIKYAHESLEINPVVNENTWGYATQKFTFKNTALRDVIAAIEKSTTYSFEWGSTLEKCELTATFENISTDEMVNFIAESLDLSVTKNGNVFTLQGEGCQ